MSGLRTRIAPTPSGYLHAGNAVNFLITHQLAREAGGSVLLRIDDLDSERTRPEYVQDIFDSLQWLDITWDEGPRDPEDFARNWSQALRSTAADQLLQALRTAGHLFACTCSRKQATGCACSDRDLPFNAGDTAWRLRMPDPCPVVLNRWPNGDLRIDARAVMREPVLRQRNGLPAYQLASLADDLRFSMTLIVRGGDLLPSSACQSYIAGLLGLQPYLDVRFLHHALLTDSDGRKLSKSEGASSLRAMRKAGASADALRERAAGSLADARAQGL